MTNKEQELLDEVVRSIYERGYADGNKSGYERGYNNRKIEEEFEEKPNNYEQGLNDAWECARKIFVPVDKGGLSVKEVIQIFNIKAPNKIFDNYSALEAITKIKEYEEQTDNNNDEIKVGDELYRLDANYHGVVTAVWEDCGVVKIESLTQSGKLACDDAKDLHRTGRHFPEIAEVLKQMQEGKQ